VIYYLISLLGESMARVGSISPYIGPWVATAMTLVMTGFLLFKNRLPWFSLPQIRFGTTRQKATTPSVRAKNIVNRGIKTFGFPNLMDATLLKTLATSFIVGFVALAAIFNIFTLFELWRFIAVTGASAGLVARYL